MLSIDFKTILHNSKTRYGLSILALLSLIAIFSPWIAPFDPIAIHLDQRLLPINSLHWCGTDELGRDILSRLMYGCRITLKIVLLVTLFTAPLGLILGSAAGFLGGIADAVIMRFTDLFLSFPKLILAMALSAALGPGLDNAIISISLTAWAPYARLCRAATLSLRSRDFIHAIRLQGASNTRIICKHIMPLCLPTLFTRINLDMAGFILTAAGLSFIGLGAQPPLPEWGAMLASSRNYLLTHWWAAFFPGLAIFIVSLGFNLFGEGLRDYYDRKGVSL